MRSMRRVLRVGIGVTALAGTLVLGGAWWSGVETETQYRAWIAEVNRAQGGFRLSNASYRRDWFQSDVVTHIEMEVPGGHKTLSLLATHEVHHGPLPRASWFRDGAFSPAWSVVRTRFRFDGDSGQDVAMGAYAGKDAVGIVSMLRLDASSRHDISIAGAQFSDSATGAAWRFSGAEGRYELSADGTQVAGEIKTADFGLIRVGRRGPAPAEVPEAPAAADPRPDTDAGDDVSAAAAPRPEEGSAAADDASADADSGAMEHTLTEVSLRNFSLRMQAHFAPGAIVWPTRVETAVDSARLAASAGGGTETVDVMQAEFSAGLEATGENVNLRYGVAVADVLANGRRLGHGAMTLDLTRLHLPSLLKLQDTAALAFATGVLPPAGRKALMGSARALLARDPGLHVEIKQLVLADPAPPISASLQLNLRNPVGAIDDPVPLLIGMPDSGYLRLDVPGLHLGDWNHANTPALVLVGLSTDLELGPGIGTIAGSWKLEALQTRWREPGSGWIRVELDGLAGSTAQTRNEDGLLLGQAKLSCQSLNVRANPATAPFAMRGFGLSTEAHEAGGFISLLAHLDVEHLTPAAAPVPGGGGSVTLGMAQLQSSTLGKLQHDLYGVTLRRLTRMLDEHGDTAADPRASLWPKLAGAAQALLRHRPELTVAALDVRLDGDAHPLAGDMRVVLGLPSTFDTHQTRFWRELLSTAEGRLQVPESVLKLQFQQQARREMQRETELAAAGSRKPAAKPRNLDDRLQDALDAQLKPWLQQGWVRRVAGTVSSEVKLHEGALTLNDQPAPLPF